MIKFGSYIRVFWCSAIRCLLEIGRFGPVGVGSGRWIILFRFDDRRLLVLRLFLVV